MLNVPCPAKNIRLAKKAVIPIYSMRASAVSAWRSLATASLCGGKEEATERTFPAFWLRRPLFCPGNKEAICRSDHLELIKDDFRALVRKNSYFDSVFLMRVAKTCPSKKE